MTAEAAIRDTRAAFVAALRAGDAFAASAVYAKQARLLPPSAELLHGRAAIEAFWRAGIDAGISDAELKPVSLECFDEIAYEIGRYTLRLRGEDGNVVVDRGKYLLVHERQRDRSWRWAAEMFNPESPPASSGRRAA